MPVLTRDEKETIITFDETPADAVIFTYNKTWQKHLEKNLGFKPTINNGWGAREYRIPKSRIKLPRAPKRISAEQRRKMGQRLKEARRQKLANRPKNNAAIINSQGKNFHASNSSNHTHPKSKITQKSPARKIGGKK